MKWKQLGITAAALTGAALMILMISMTPAAASTSAKDVTQTATVSAQIDKIDFKILAMAHGTLAGSIAPEMMTVALSKDGGAIMTETEKKAQGGQLFVAARRESSTEVAITAVVMKAPIAIATFTDHSGLMKVAGISTARPAVALLC